MAMRKLILLFAFLITTIAFGQDVKHPGNIKAPALPNDTVIDTIIGQESDGRLVRVPFSALKAKTLFGFTSGLDSIMQDLTPELGGNVDANFYNIDSVQEVSAENLYLGGAPWSGSGRIAMLNQAENQYVSVGVFEFLSDNEQTQTYSLGGSSDWLYQKTTTQIETAPVRSLTTKEWVETKLDTLSPKFIYLPVTTFLGEGAIYKGGTLWAHSYGGDQGLGEGIGFPNTFMGKQAGNLYVTGNSNHGFGSYALFSLTYGARNSAFGGSALQSLTVGSDNMAMGSNSLAFLVDGYSNTAIGKNALQNITSGSTNVAIGRNTGYWHTAIAGGNELTNSNGGIYIGYQAIPGNNNPSNQLVIGNGVTGYGDNTQTIGNTAITQTILAGSARLRDHSNMGTNDYDLATKKYVDDGITTANNIYSNYTIAQDTIAANTVVMFNTGSNKWQPLDMWINLPPWWNIQMYVGYGQLGLAMNTALPEGTVNVLLQGFVEAVPISSATAEAIAVNDNGYLGRESSNWRYFGNRLNVGNMIREVTPNVWDIWFDGFSPIFQKNVLPGGDRVLEGLDGSLLGTTSAGRIGVNAIQNEQIQKILGRAYSDISGTFTIGNHYFNKFVRLNGTSTITLQAMNYMLDAQEIYLLINTPNTITFSVGSGVTLNGKTGSFSYVAPYAQNTIMKLSLVTDDKWILSPVNLLPHTAPATATSVGLPGEIRITSTYIYYCVAENTWVRQAVATW